MTSEETKHLPWEIIHRDYDGGFEVNNSDGNMMFDDGSAYDEYNKECSIERAEFIVEAVNAHDRLTAENKRLREALEYIQDNSSGSVREMARVNLSGGPGKENI